jgi:hypothetical protein
MPLPTEMETELPPKGRASTAAVAHRMAALARREGLKARPETSMEGGSFIVMKPK